MRLKYFGETSGLAQCIHHSPNLQLVHKGEIHEANWWGGNGRFAKDLLSQLRTAMESNPKTWIEDYDIPKLASLLEARTALREMLQTHLKTHSGDAGASAEQALAELQRVRFIARPEDDAEENHDGQMDLSYDYLTLDGRWNRAVGLRFMDVPVPQGARIKRAYVQFVGNAFGGWENEGLIFHGELTANAASFQDLRNNITSRRKTVASVQCPPEIWDARSLQCRTSDLASVIQEITDQPDWREGNALVLIVGGSSQGEAASWEWNQGHWNQGSDMAMLYVEVE